MPGHKLWHALLRFSCTHPSLCHTLTQEPSRAIPSFFFIDVAHLSPLPTSTLMRCHVLASPAFPPSLNFWLSWSLLLTHHPPPHLPTTTNNNFLLVLSDPMCALCSRSWGQKRSISAHAETGTKAPSAARRRKSLAKKKKISELN